MTRAYANLEELELRFESMEDDEGDHLNGLRILLGSTFKLRRLRLLLPPVFLQTGWQNHDLIFPADGLWLHLTAIRLHNLNIHLKDCIEFLILRMPHLRQMQLGNIHLLEGSWRGVFELLKYGAHLNVMKIDKNSHLLHHGRNIDFMRENRINNVDVGKLAEYVVKGQKNPSLKHPCLDRRQYNHESRVYLEDVLQVLERTSLACRAMEVVRSAIGAAERLNVDLTLGREFTDAEKLASRRKLAFQVVEINGRPTFDVEVEGEVRRLTSEEFSALMLETMGVAGVSSAAVNLNLQ